jgi:hypothetical protein
MFKPGLTSLLDMLNKNPTQRYERPRDPNHHAR